MKTKTPFRMVSIVLLLSIISAGNSIADYSMTVCGPTPSDFEENFNNYCNAIVGDTIRCATALEQFKGAFRGKDPSQVEFTDYNSYFDAIGITPIRDKAIFWSGTRDLTRLLNMMRDFVISSIDISAGRILNEFPMETCWCWDNAASALDTTNACSNRPTINFWAQYSVRVAQASQGVVFFLPNSSRMEPYGSTSFFKCYEIPNFDPNEVTRLVTLNIHQQDSGESCGQGSLKTLCQDVTARNIGYACYDIIGSLEDAEEMGDTWNKLINTIRNIQSGMDNTVTHQCLAESSPSDSTDSKSTSAASAACAPAFMATLFLLPIFL